MHSLARTLAASPLWRDLPGAVLIVRPPPQAALGVAGSFEPGQEKLLRALGSQVAAALSSLRYVSYSRVEEDCWLLADRLVERLGREELSRYRFVALPRGGYVVLGMLSYALEVWPKSPRELAA